MTGLLLGGPAAALLTLRDRGLVVAVISNTSYADPEAIAVSVAAGVRRAARHGRAGALNVVHRAGTPQSIRRLCSIA